MQRTITVDKKDSPRGFEENIKSGFEEKGRCESFS